MAFTFVLVLGAWLCLCEWVEICEDWTICAFCFRTSAGVRIRQETISAVDEAMAWIIGVGREWVKGSFRVVFEYCV